MNEQDIANIVAQWTGIPIEKVSADETERLIKMEEVLHGRVIGQVRLKKHRPAWLPSCCMGKGLCIKYALLLCACRHASAFVSPL